MDRRSFLRLGALASAVAALPGRLIGIRPKKAAPAALDFPRETVATYVGNDGLVVTELRVLIPREPWPVPLKTRGAHERPDYFGWEGVGHVAKNRKNEKLIAALGAGRPVDMDVKHGGARYRGRIVGREAQDLGDGALWVSFIGDGPLVREAL